MCDFKRTRANEMNNPRERVVLLPKELLEKCNGYSFDFGGSVIKVCYLAKSDWENGPTEETDGKLTLTSFAREELDECLDFLREKSFIRRTEETPHPVMYTTGIGGFQYGKLIEERLNVTIENISEMDGFVLTMEFLLDNKPLDEFCVPFDQEEVNAVHEESRKMSKIFSEVKQKGHMNLIMNPSGPEALESTYDRTANIKPYLLGSFGSAWGCMKIGCYDKGDFSFSNFTTLAGRSFLGLGCLLTGAKDYRELITLAEEGNSLSLDQSEQDVAERTDHVKDSTAGDMYSDWSKEEPTLRPIFQWGKAVGKNLADFKREDVARTLLKTFCHHLANVAYDALIHGNVRHVFMAGGFCSNPLIQKMVLNEFEYRKWLMVSSIHGRDGDYHMHFLQYGSHFGAIGAIMKGLELSKKNNH